ncbi:MAG: sigma 54-interacting transcriptional regulator [Victivallales bacterium]|nr:sigma 54-interacting transcriptional regulator [Victivallales bacterium]
MALCRDREREIAEAIGKLDFTNPFIPERDVLEKTALTTDYRPPAPLGNIAAEKSRVRFNTIKLRERSIELLTGFRKRLLAPETTLADGDLEIYENLVIYYLFESYRGEIKAYFMDQSGKYSLADCYRRFLADWNYYLHLPERPFTTVFTPVKMFEMYYQIRRAFHYIFDFLIGRSAVSSRLRASIWQSVFTHDIIRYHRLLYNRMQSITTLITGPSGTGKELVARAIALSQHIPFDDRKLDFIAVSGQLFFPLHLSAMPQTLIESELFGHRKGAFTGAVQDRVGWLETCSEYGTVFLDEIGEISQEVQVKLLRVLQSRKFQRLGDNTERYYRGKLLAATNCNLLDAIERGKFRGDLYYRLCSDIVETPPLRDQLGGSERELNNFVQHLATAIVGQNEAEALADEATAWIKQHLGLEYAWPGNVRELEQCLRNIIIRGNYSIPVARPAPNHDNFLFRELKECRLTADELLNLYCLNVYERTGSCLAAAKILNLDRRTVKKRAQKARAAD